MASISYSQVAALGDFHARYAFEMSILVAPVGVIVPTDMDIRVTSATIPKYIVPNEEFILSGHRINTPGMPQPEAPITLNMVETVGNETRAFLASWNAVLGANPDTNIQLPRVATEATIRLHQLNRQRQPVWEYQLQGCKLESYDLGSWDSAQQEGSMTDVSVTISWQAMTEGPV